MKIWLWNFFLSVWEFSMPRARPANRSSATCCPGQRPQLTVLVNSWGSFKNTALNRGKYIYTNFTNNFTMVRVISVVALQAASAFRRNRIFPINAQRLIKVVYLKWKSKSGKQIHHDDVHIHAWICIFMPPSKRNW